MSHDRQHRHHHHRYYERSTSRNPTNPYKRYRNNQPITNPVSHPASCTASHSASLSPPRPRTQQSSGKHGCRSVPSRRFHNPYRRGKPRRFRRAPLQWEPDRCATPIFELGTNSRRRRQLPAYPSIGRSLSIMLRDASKRASGRGAEKTGPRAPALELSTRLAAGVSPIIGSERTAHRPSPLPGAG